MNEQVHFQPSVFRIFLASPGDVQDERTLARDVIEQIRHERAFRGRVNLECIAWDQPGAEVAMEASLTPQEAIKRGLPKPSDCDLVVVILWSRMGTPLPAAYTKPDGTAYLSGTEWEYFEAKHSGKPRVWLYRRSQVPDLNLEDPEFDDKRRQWQTVKTFFQDFVGADSSLTGGVNTYQTPDQFRKKFEQHLRDHVTEVLERLRGPAPEVPSSKEAALKERPPWTDKPYPGLEAFKPEQAPIFFGRGREVDQLLEVLRVPAIRFVGVVGASGSGKSSLVAAGLIPRLRAGALPGSSNWVDITFKPGERGGDPFVALGYALKAALGTTGQREVELAQDLRANPDVFVSCVDNLLDNRSRVGELVLVIDQFEEIFTLVPDDARTQFIELFATVAKTPKVRMLVTMRAEFLAKAVEIPVLAELFRGRGFFSLSAPGVLALTEMIRRPAQIAGLEVPEDLCERILKETGTGPGALALMAFTLHELYERGKQFARLTLQDYESLGGVTGAIQAQAEKALKRLGHKDDHALHALFSDLVEVNDQGVATRRRASLNEIRKDSSKGRLVDGLVDARILVTDLERTDNPSLEVAHEAIFTSWQRFVDWIEGRRDDLRLLRQVRLAAAEWDRQVRAPHFLWPHERLVLVSQMVKRMHPKLTALEREFIRPESERLLEEINQASTTHQQRAKIGDRLAEIGDPRSGVGLRPDGLPDIVWCKVPGAKITIQADAGTFRVDSFYIAKYPVTWIQYRSFLEAKDGYRKEQWWEGLAVRADKPGEQYRKLDNHPAENVSWYDAVAFCRWLTNRLSYEVRLPTEWEWQQAATGGDPDMDNGYPWGARWDSERANTYECGLSRTTAVGMYPHGSSPVGALDISGNVREWCLNEYDNPNRVEASGDARRVVRGGCFSDYRSLAHAASRYGVMFPDGRTTGVGFRLCSSSPIF